MNSFYNYIRHILYFVKLILFKKINYDFKNIGTTVPLKKLFLYQLRLFEFE